MSASQEKKNRAELRSAGNDKKLNAATEKSKQDKSFRCKAIVAFIIVVIVIAGAFVVNSNLFYTKIPAVQIGSTSYSAAEVNCYYEMAYNTVYNQFYQTYGDAAQYLIDRSKPLDEQQYSETQTWADYLSEVALDNMKQITALYDAAMSSGYTLTAEDTETIESSIATMQSAAVSYGYQNLTGFLAANYGGKGMTEELYRDILTKTTVAYAYAAQVGKSFTYTEDTLKAYYAEHKDELDTINYAYQYVSSADAQFDDLADDAKAAAAHDAAAEIAKATTEEDFAAAVQAFVGEDAAVGTDRAQGQMLSETFSGWLLDANRAEGDTTVIDTDGGSYALRFILREDNDYNTVAMRHILISAEADENGEYTDEALAAAEAAAQEIYAEWQADPTEESFAALANAHSSDNGSNTNGGLYENIYHGNMVEEIDAFLFDPAAKPGDTAVVFGSNGAYAGYHVVYFVGTGDLFCDYLAKNALSNEDYSSFLTTTAEPYAVTTGFGMKFTDLSK